MLWKGKKEKVYRRKKSCGEVVGREGNDGAEKRDREEEEGNRKG